MSSVFNALPMRRANIWDCPSLRTHGHGQLQVCYSNELKPEHARAGAVCEMSHANVPVTGTGEPTNVPFYVSVNQDAQQVGRPLPMPFDAPPYQSCAGGPTRVAGHDYCITNVKMTRENPGQRRPAQAPICWPGGVPTIVGRVYDHKDHVNWTAWQCLPPWRGSSL